MSGGSYFFLFFPVALVILLVLEMCRSDDPKRIVKRTLANLGLLTAVLAVGSVVAFLMNRFL